VQVTGTGSCLNVRIQPGLSNPNGDVDPNTSVLNCLPDGFVARIGDDRWRQQVAQPVQADGHWWWYLFGQGWAAEDWLTFHRQGDIFYPKRPELAAEGLIAYLGADNNLYLMSADGTGHRLVQSRSSDFEHFGTIRWSPNGDLLSLTFTRYDPSGSTVSTRIVNTAGTLVAEYPGLAEAVWSPDGSRLSAIRVERPGEMGGYYGQAVVLQLATGTETPVAPGHFSMTAPAWSPDGATLAYACTSWSSQEAQPDGTISEIRHDCGGDGLKIVGADGSGAWVVLPFNNESQQFYSSPSWSPDGGTIGLSVRGRDESGCRGYAVLTIATGTVGPCLSLPPWGGYGGGCGGSPEMGATDWSPDSRLLAYHSMYGAGTNGVYLYDTVSGSTRLVPISGADSVSFSSDGAHLAFGGAGYVWAVDTDGSGLAILAEGSAPAWQP
jgi:hypothetical protein